MQWLFENNKFASVGLGEVASAFIAICDTEQFLNNTFYIYVFKSLYKSQQSLQLQIMVKKTTGST